MQTCKLCSTNFEVTEAGKAPFVVQFCPFCGKSLAEEPKISVLVEALPTTVKTDEIKINVSPQTAKVEVDVIRIGFVQKT